jgi:hypothetical protein
MKTKIISVLWMLVLSGCTLAKAPEMLVKQECEIIGIYITTESMLIQGTVLDTSDHTQTYALINKHEKNGASYVESIVSGKFYDSLMDVHVTDEMVRNTFTAKVPVLMQESGVVINHYEIIKTADETFVIGNAMNGIGLNGDGTASVNFGFSKDSEINGLKTSESLSFDLEYVPINRLLSLKLIELNEDHTKLMETDMMETSEINLQETTQYMLVEEERMTSDGTLIRDVTAYARKQSEVIEHMIIRTPESEVFASPDTLRFIP